ncbi:hypothetical protein SARC_04687 [Sphaeroforma arctica JP610]|uniref:Uncharacterized protein n=1 Tax=Sphaeroforma arctica JP610 TaxID=667725 RepID=A0A0L0G2H8_9EUKA|nr:hypothetical protein SARC_04687 [Sphaeroforma arctica JP610]KNC83039.1 hypothetical protein SARC_04687 [Sphaeroforma arctica JP610]|eukprot:XP_014156941.1 hypothetical protein SARC_04687 [Sphaeroforma arctica JP610]
MLDSITEWLLPILDPILHILMSTTLQYVVVACLMWYLIAQGLNCLLDNQRPRTVKKYKDVRKKPRRISQFPSRPELLIWEPSSPELPLPNPKKELRSGRNKTGLP